jgi:hypothetical protein
MTTSKSASFPFSFVDLIDPPRPSTYESTSALIDKSVVEALDGDRCMYLEFSGVYPIIEKESTVEKWLSYNPQKAKAINEAVTKLLEFDEEPRLSVIAVPICVSGTTYGLGRKLVLECDFC